MTRLATPKPLAQELELLGREADAAQESIARLRREIAALVSTTDSLTPRRRRQLEEQLMYLRLVLRTVTQVSDRTRGGEVTSPRHAPAAIAA